MISLQEAKKPTNSGYPNLQNSYKKFVISLNSDFTSNVKWISDVQHAHIHAVIRKDVAVHVIKNHFIEQIKFYLMSWMW